MKKPLAIDAIVRWAYRMELPKEPAARRGASFLRRSSFVASWAALSRTAELGTGVDEPDLRNRYGLFADAPAMDGPHPDAVRLWHAVQQLETMNVTLPHGWDPLSDLKGITDDVIGDFTMALAREAGIERLFFHVHGHPKATVRGGSARIEHPAPEERRRLGLRRSVPDLIQKHAVLGGAPDWQTETPVRMAVRNSHGGPRWFRMVDGTEVEGFDPKARRPYPLAYQKFYFDPDLTDIVEARAEYWVWFAAMVELARLLAGALDAHEVLPPSLPAAPWDADGVHLPRIIVAA